MRIVAKFGGSSLANAAQFKKVKSIIQADPQRQYVVVSAAGKGSDQSVKLTDQLIQIYNAYHANQDYRSLIQAVRQRLQLLSVQLGLRSSVQSRFSETVNHLANLSYADLVSRGEYLTATLMADYLGWPMIDSQKWLLLRDGKVDLAESKRRLDVLLSSHQHAILPGFYGFDEAGQIQLLPRGGGDTSGAIVANLVDADRYENWTDTDGILITDPRIVKNPRAIDILSYNELQELAYLGMQVFQEEAIQPVRMKQIPVVIKNTNAPQNEGTWVVSNKRQDQQRYITGITGKQDQTLLTVQKYHLSDHIDCLLNIVNTLKPINPKFTYSFDGTDRLNVTLDNWQSDHQKHLAIQTIQDILRPDQIEVENALSLVGVITDQLIHNPMMVGRIVSYLEQEHVDVQTIFQNSGDAKIVLGVNPADYQRTVSLLYRLTLENHLKSFALAAVK